MPLTVVNTVADSERQQTDIEFIEVVNDRLFTTDGNLVKVRIISVFPEKSVN